jgi:DNA-directed RNA polymerase subunit alpha
MNIQTIGDLLNITETELLSYKNFGETSLREIKVILESKTLHLGMSLEEKQPAASIISEQDSPPSVEEAENDVLQSKPIDDLQLSVRARKCLQKLNIRTIGELVHKTEAELLGCKNFGVTSLNEIKKTLSNIGLSLRNLD